MQPSPLHKIFGDVSVANYKGSNKKITVIILKCKQQL